MKRTGSLVIALFSILLAVLTCEFLLLDKEPHTTPAFTVGYRSSDDKAIRYNVLLNGYMRSGSSFTGELLGHRDDTFYIYEPLRNLLRMSYWHGNYSICKANRFECRVSDDSVEEAKHILRSIYDCNFHFINKKTVWSELTIRKGGPRLEQVTRCYKQENPAACTREILPNVCKTSTHKVTKVLRLTTDILGELLHERASLKVIHLLRDPRAVINSRIQTKWYPLPASQIINNAKSLCHKMLYDFRKGKALHRLYPDRFRFVYYEDITKDIEKKVKILLRYLGMSVNSTDDFAKYKSDNTFKWRNILKWDVVRSMQPVCANVYKELGYKSFSEEEYMNMTFKTVDIPKEYLIS